MRQAYFCLTALSLLFLEAGKAGLAEGRKGEGGPRQEAGPSVATYHGGMVTRPCRSRNSS